MEKKLMRTVNENGGLGSKNTILLSKQKKYCKLWIIDETTVIYIVPLKEVALFNNFCNKCKVSP